MLRHVEDVWPLRGASLLARLAQDWPKALNLLTGFVREIRSKGNYSKIINLTPTVSARILTRMLAIDGAEVLGFGMDENGFGINAGYWAAFLNVASKRRGSSPFNIADVFRMTGQSLLKDAMPGPEAGKLLSPPQQARSWSLDFLSKCPEARPGKNLIALQLGASNPDRQWPVENFVAFGSALHERGFIPVLLGAPAERPLAETFAAQAHFPFIDAIGKTSILQLGSLLENCRLLATNDTGTMHLASGLGVHCLAFFLATAQPWDTGPYSVDNCCVEPALDCHPCSFNRPCTNMHACLKRIEPDYASNLALAWLQTGDWRQGLAGKACESIRVWVTRRDACGFADLDCISGHQDKGRNAWLTWQRYFWRQILDWLTGTDLPCAVKPPAFPPPEKNLEEAVPVLRQVCGMLESLHGAAALAGKNPRAGKILLKGCEKVQMLLDTCASLASFGDFWRELNNDITDIAKFMHQNEILASTLKRFADDLVGAR